MKYSVMGEHVPMTQYLIKKTVYFCYVDSQVIFLDLKQGKYFGIDRHQAAVLKGVVAGWNAPTPIADGTDEAVDERVSRSVTKDLVDRGVLTVSHEAGKRATPTRTNRATLNLITEYSSQPPSIRLHHVVTFATAYLCAAAILRMWSFARIARRIETKIQQVGQPAERKNIERLRELVAIYSYIRPFFFRASDKCLLDSLVLSEFLGRYNVCPTWMLGVSTDPFLAHSWLEMDRFVINDSTLRVNCFTPIFAQ